MKTFHAKADAISRKWLLINAEGKILGRLATEIASMLRGKHKPEYTPSVDVGDYIVVINAAKIAVTGNKEQDKKYYRYTGYPGGLRTVNLSEQRAKHPERILEAAVSRMLPKNPLGRKMFKKLKIYAGTEHPHDAQGPQAIEV